MKRKPAPASQRGVVLIATVILLVMLTILALAAVSMNSTQTRVATNSADQQVAYQTAEGALNIAENALISGGYSVNDFLAGKPGLYIFDASVGPVWQTNPNIWTQAGKTVTTTFSGGSNAAAQFIVEKLPPVTLPGQAMSSFAQVYRVTAYGVGKSGKSPVVLQSTMQIQ